MPKDRIDDGRDNEGNDEVTGESHSLRDGSRNNGCCGADETHLEQEEGHQPGCALVAEQEARGSEQSPDAGAEHESETEQPEDCGGQEEVGEVLGGDVDAVLGSHQAALECGEAGLHQHDESSRDQDPYDVDGFGSAQWSLLGLTRWSLRNHVEARLGDRWADSPQGRVGPRMEGLTRWLGETLVPSAEPDQTTLPQLRLASCLRTGVGTSGP